MLRALRYCIIVLIFILFEIIAINQCFVTMVIWQEAKRKARTLTWK